MRDLYDELVEMGINVLILPYGDMPILDYANNNNLHNLISCTDFELGFDFDTENGADQLLNTVQKNRYYEKDVFSKTIVQVNDYRTISIIIYGAINE